MSEELQPSLFEASRATTDLQQLYPDLWTATEDLISSEIELRRCAVEQLAQMGVLSSSVLVVYVMATRLEEPDVPLRTRVIRLLGELLLPEGSEAKATAPVRQQLIAYLSQARTRTIYCMLQAAAYDSRLEGYLAQMLNACPYAGSHLTDILGNNKNPLPVRKEAAHYIGVVGYLDAISALERIASRLETRLSGQAALPFAAKSQPSDSEEELLPYIYSSLLLLKVP